LPSSAPKKLLRLPLAERLDVLFLCFLSFFPALSDPTDDDELELDPTEVERPGRLCLFFLCLTSSVTFAATPPATPPATAVDPDKTLVS